LKEVKRVLILPWFLCSREEGDEWVTNKQLLGIKESIYKGSIFLKMALKETLRRSMSFKERVIIELRIVTMEVP
jgi:hypothetical protein